MQLNEVAQNFRARSRADASRVDVVLQGNGNAMESAAVAMTLAAARSEELGFGFLCLSEGEFGGDGDIRVDRRIELLDAGKHEIGELDGRKCSLSIKFHDRFDRVAGE